ncbi:MAG: TetR family transcriptional regulator [Spirochaetae bacterium HGW-Spirochaetae-7]|jgi:TetR/AcrR family transcriptional repressor of nem operon|nr:MAG: TetR family transcriptional regulator [Spirochaetae bacterium HGW-Spirochaetae-7]
MPWEKQFDVDEVLGKAIDAFWCRGFAATSMQDLVERTGVNRASLYATYGDKRTLFITALKSYDESRRRALFADLEARCEPKEAIRQLFFANTAQASRPGEQRGCFMANTALELAQHDKEIGAIVAEAQEEMEAFLFRMIERGKADGKIPELLDATTASRSLLASLLGILVLVRSRPEKKLLDDVVAEAMRKLN